MRDYNEVLKRLNEIKPDASEARTTKTITLDNGTTFSLRANGVRPKAFTDSAVKEVLGSAAKVQVRGMNDTDDGIGFRDVLNGAQAVALAWGKPVIKQAPKEKETPKEALTEALKQRGANVPEAAGANGQ